MTRISSPVLALRSAALLAALSLLPPALLAQPGKEPIPDAVMLKRMAEAIEGFRGSGQAYVVGSLEGLHPVTGVFSDPIEAARAAKVSGPGFKVFGPVLVLAEKTPPFTVACVHVAKTSVMFPESNKCVGPGRPLPFEQLKTLTLLLGRTDGTTDTLRLPAGTDAIMLTSTAFDKFAVPYYLRILGLAGVAELRNGFAGIYQTGSIPKP